MNSEDSIESFLRNACCSGNGVFELDINAPSMPVSSFFVLSSIRLSEPYSNVRRQLVFATRSFCSVTKKNEYDKCHG